ncbi:MAG: hypothetical protein WBX25_11370 [Rhodomicrobium sp.]
MDAIEPNTRALAIFAVAWLICCAGAIHLSGLFPFAQAPTSIRTAGGAALLCTNVAFLLAVTALTLVYCFKELRWTSIVVVGGLIFLGSPFIAQDLPDAIKASKAGLALLATLLMLVIAILLAAGAQDFVLRASDRT